MRWFAASLPWQVDLDGWNHGGRPALLAARPAPITVHLIQFPGAFPDLKDDACSWRGRFRERHLC